MDDRLLDVLGHFGMGGASVSSIIPIPAGLSGGDVWRIERFRLPSLALRRWPRDYPLPRVRAINGVLVDMLALGLNLLPAPLSTNDGSLTLAFDSHAWDLCAWLSGAPAENPNPVQCRAAVDMLARWHRAGNELDEARVRSFDREDSSRRPASLKDARSTSSAVVRRRKCWDELASIVDEKLPEADDPMELIPRTRLLVHDARCWIGASLDRAASCKIPMRLCLGDAHAEHFLFKGDRLTGLIDFGALTIDSDAVDLGRYLSSICFSEPLDALLDFYAERMLFDEEMRTVAKCVARVSGVLACLNWLNWLIVQKRGFVDRRRAYARWAHVLDLVERAQRMGIGSEES